MPPKSPLANKALLFNAVSSTRCVRDALKMLGMRAAGGNYTALYRWAAIHGIVVPKYDMKTHGRGSITQTKTNEEVFVENSTYCKGFALKRRMFALGIPNICAECGIGDSWNKKKLVLQLEHINGVHDDNRLENLCFLCPNCHSQTDTFAGKNCKKVSNKH